MAVALALLFSWVSRLCRGGRSLVEERGIDTLSRFGLAASSNIEAP